MEKKYTIEELQTNDKLVVYLNSEEEYNRVKSYLTIHIINPPFSKYHGNHCYSLHRGTYSSSSSATSLGMYFDCIMVKFNQIDFMGKKIIGYKCPMNLFNDDIIKGTIYKINKNNPLFYTPVALSYISSADLPKEIVETWEAIYEDTENIVNFNSIIYDLSAITNNITIVECVVGEGINNTICKWTLKKGDSYFTEIAINGKEYKYTISWLRDILGNSVYNDTITWTYHWEFTSVKLGCNKVLLNIEILKQLIVIYNKLNS